MQPRKIRWLQCTVSSCPGKEKQALIHTSSIPRHQNKYFSFPILFIWTGSGGCPFHKTERITGKQLQRSYPQLPQNIVYGLEQMTCTTPLTTHHPSGPAHVRTIVLIKTRKRSYEQGGKKAKVHELHIQVCKEAQKKVMFTTFFWKSVRFQHLNFPFCKIIIL